MSKNTASEKRLKTTEQSGNVTTTAIGDRFKKIQQTPKQSGQHSHSQQIQDNRKEAKTVRPTQPQPTDSRQKKKPKQSGQHKYSQQIQPQNRSQNSQDNTATGNRFETTEQKGRDRNSLRMRWVPQVIWEIELRTVQDVTHKDELRDPREKGMCKAFTYCIVMVNSLTLTLFLSSLVKPSVSRSSIVGPET